MKDYITIDIGGTSIKYGIIREDGLFAETASTPTEAFEQGGPGIVHKVTHIVEKLSERYMPAGICISTAGMVDCDAGKITYASPLIPDYTGTEWRQILENHFNLPCEVENDVNCAGLAEYHAGAARGSRISVCLTIGTGIGGAIIIDGDVFHGFSGSGCEVGYMHLPGGEFQDLGASSVLSRKVAEQKSMPPESVDGKYVFDQARLGDPVCIQAIDEMADVLGMGIANICYVVNPEVVVLGGGIMVEKEYLGDKMRTSLERYLLPSVAEHTRLAFAENRNNAGMLGAFYHFKSRHTND